MFEDLLPPLLGKLEVRDLWDIISIIFVQLPRIMKVFLHDKQSELRSNKDNDLVLP